MTSTDAEETPSAQTTARVEEDTAQQSPLAQIEADGTQIERADDREDGEIFKTDQYLWYRCECDPDQFNGQSCYWLNIETNESRWDEPDEPYWIWDAATQGADPAGLQQPSSLRKAGTSTDNKPDAASSQAQDSIIVDNVVYEKYNPKIHGDYDPAAPYAKYHEKLREIEEARAASSAEQAGMSSEDHYAAMATFNSRTGAFQSADKNAEQHNDYNKSTRQLNAYFDVDAAANAHGGQSLKAERREQRYTKKEVQEMREKRKEKQRKKRLDFYRS